MRREKDLLDFSLLTMNYLPILLHREDYVNLS
jgi:hypothetical protein